jgi:hypothetical protein
LGQRTNLGCRIGFHNHTNLETCPGSNDCINLGCCRDPNGRTNQDRRPDLNQHPSFEHCTGPIRHAGSGHAPNLGGGSGLGDDSPCL